MELGKLFGLPAHPLLVHAPVALIPLCAAGAILIVVSASWRQRIGWVVVVLAGVAGVASQLAASSGEALQEALDRESQLIHRHAELGETFVWFAIAFFVALLALMIWDTMQRRAAAGAGDNDSAAPTGRTVMLILSIVVVITAVGASYRVYQVGHSGAKAVWSEVAVPPAG
jgi:magnesium-transporting ATPase (P-type)